MSHSITVHAGKTGVMTLHFNGAFDGNINWLWRNAQRGSEGSIDAGKFLRGEIESMGDDIPLPLLGRALSRFVQVYMERKAVAAIDGIAIGEGGHAG